MKIIILLVGYLPFLGENEGGLWFRGRDRDSNPFLEAPVITGPVKLFCFPFQMRVSLKSFENCKVNLSAKETKWTSLEVRTQPNFLETLISKYDFGPVKLPGLSRNGPLARLSCNRGVDFCCV